MKGTKQHQKSQLQHTHQQATAKISLVAQMPAKPVTARKLATAGKPATAETPVTEETTASAGKPTTAKTPAIREKPATTDR